MIFFRKPSDLADVSAHSIDVITTLCAVSGVRDVTITSVRRTAAAQAHAMFVNCRADIKRQKTLYAGKPGEHVVEVYLARNEHRLPDEQILAAMERKIIDLGPGNVSRHCDDSKRLNVIDISFLLIAQSQRTNFHNAIRKESRISRFYDPFTAPADPAFHIEIPVPEPNAETTTPRFA
jgi:hypothetical protein